MAKVIQAPGMSRAMCRHCSSERSGGGSARRRATAACADGKPRWTPLQRMQPGRPAKPRWPLAPALMLHQARPQGLCLPVPRHKFLSDSILLYAQDRTSFSTDVEHEELSIELRMAASVQPSHTSEQEKKSCSQSRAYVSATARSPSRPTSTISSSQVCRSRQRTNGNNAHTSKIGNISDAPDHRSGLCPRPRASL